MAGNSDSSVAERPWLFKNGQSGNPSGRPRDAFDFAAAARKHAPEYLQVLLRSLKSNNWRERHSALSLLMDRAFSKPTQPITGEDGQPVTLLHLVAMREIGEAIVAELAQRTVIDGVAKPVNGHGTTVEAPAAVGDLSIPARE